MSGKSVLRGAESSVGATFFAPNEVDGILRLEDRIIRGYVPLHDPPIVSEFTYAPLDVKELHALRRRLPELSGRALQPISRSSAPSPSTLTTCLPCSLSVSPVERTLRSSLTAGLSLRLWRWSMATRYSLSRSERLWAAHGAFCLAVPALFPVVTATIGTSWLAARASSPTRPCPLLYRGLFFVMLFAASAAPTVPSLASSATHSLAELLRHGTSPLAVVALQTLRQHVEAPSFAASKKDLSPADLRILRAYKEAQLLPLLPLLRDIDGDTVGAFV